MKPTVNIFLDTRKQLKTGKYPLKLSVTAGRINRSWSFGFAFSQAEYEKLLKNTRRDPYKDTWNAIQAKLLKAEKAIEGMLPFFTFEEFKQKFFAENSISVINDKTSLLYILEAVCEDYIQKDQWPMSVKLRDSVKSILKFSGTDNLPMRAINPMFCRRYEEYMLSKSKKKSRNGAGINLRHIRILFNAGIERGLIPREYYPFKRSSGDKSEFLDAYIIPNERKVKEFLDEQELVRFSRTNTFKNAAQRRAHHAFLISFYCNGANAADFLRFKYSDIHGEFIIFYRQKVKNATRADMKPVKVFLGSELKELIEEIGNTREPDDYIFDIYKPGMTEQEMYAVRKRFNNNASKSLKQIASSLGIEKNLKLGNARHSLANLLKRNGVSREVVKDLFGHTSITTIDNYYESFQDDQFKDIAVNIVSLSRRANMTTN